MPFFVSARELKRLEREVSSARKRADEAERRLEAERQARDTLNLAVLDHAATKDKNYAISSRLPQEEKVEVQETRDVLLERLKRDMAPQWAYYQQVAADNGKSESEAEQWLLNEATGAPQPFQQEM